MSNLPEDEEPGLLDEQASLKTSGVTWKGTMAALGELGQMGVPHFIVGPPMRSSLTSTPWRCPRRTCRPASCLPKRARRSTAPVLSSATSTP